MSVPALLKAVEARLRTALTDPDGKFVGVQVDGAPPPKFGQWYYAVHWPGSRGSGGVLDHDVTHAVTVTITAKMAYAPKDRRGDRMTLDGELIARAEAVADGGVIHGSYSVLNAANATIGPAANGFAEPLCLLGYGPVLEKGPDWVGVGADGDNPPTVLAIEVRFGQARRVQRYF